MKNIKTVYQAIFSGKYDFKNKLTKLLKKSIETIGIEFNEEEVKDFIFIKKETKIGEDKYLIKFEIELHIEPFDEENAEVIEKIIGEIIERFSELLKKSKEKISVIQ